MSCPCTLCRQEAAERAERVRALERFCAAVRNGARVICSPDVLPHFAALGLAGAVTVHRWLPAGYVVAVDPEPVGLLDSLPRWRVGVPELVS